MAASAMLSASELSDYRVTVSPGTEQRATIHFPIEHLLLPIDKPSFVHVQICQGCCTNRSAVQSTSLLSKTAAHVDTDQDKHVKIKITVELMVSDTTLYICAGGGRRKAIIACSPIS
jgi:hypothetical protein